MYPKDHAGMQVSPSSSEFQAVQERMAETMAHSTIHKLERVQNLALWDFYNMSKRKLVQLGTQPNEVSVWHGTSRTDPATIYADVQDGFMVRLSTARCDHHRHRWCWRHYFVLLLNAQMSLFVCYRPSILALGCGGWASTLQNKLHTPTGTRLEQLKGKKAFC